MEKSAGTSDCVIALHCVEADPIFCAVKMWHLFYIGKLMIMVTGNGWSSNRAMVLLKNQRTWFTGLRNDHSFFDLRTVD